LNLRRRFLLDETGVPLISTAVINASVCCRHPEDFGGDGCRDFVIKIAGPTCDREESRLPINYGPQLPIMSSANSTARQDYLNETRVPQAFVVLIICPVISLSCVSLRLYTRAFLIKRVFWEDYIMVLAMVSDDFLRVH
jgi:hypothetical protein